MNDQKTTDVRAPLNKGVEDMLAEIRAHREDSVRRYMAGSTKADSAAEEIVKYNAAIEALLAMKEGLNEGYSWLAMS